MVLNKVNTKKKLKATANSMIFSHLPAVVSPAAELHLAVLVVEGEPGDVDLAGGLEDAGGDVGAAPLARQHHVRRVRAVERLVRTDGEIKKAFFSVGNEKVC